MINLTSNINLKQLLEELRSRKDAAFNVIAIVVALVVSVVINKNIGQRIEDLNKQIAAQKKISSSAKTLNDLQNQFDKIKEGIPEEVNAYTALEEINNIAAEIAEVRLVSVAPAEAKDKSVYTEYPFSIKLDTRYAGLADFINRLESLKIFKVKTLDASLLSSRGQIEEEEPRLQVNIALTAIALKK